MAMAATSYSANCSLKSSSRPINTSNSDGCSKHHLSQSFKWSSSSITGAQSSLHSVNILANRPLARVSRPPVCTMAPAPTVEKDESRDQIRTAQRPDALGRFGKFGGKYVPETLMYALAELESAFHSLKGDQQFQQELAGILKDYVGRESPLYFAERLSEHYRRSDGGPHIYLKREDLNHTGAHKINNAVAQALLAKRIGKKRIIAETGAGQHGVATATVCARFGLQCIVYMGAQDMERQPLNVFRMRTLGAEVRAVHSGTATLKDATSEAIRDLVTNIETTHYILGSVVGPHPFPMLVREFHAVIGKETRRQAIEKWGGKPNILVACVGGGSNAMGLFHEFVNDEDVRLVGVEAAGFGLDSGKHAATLTKGEVGVLHGAMSYLLQDEEGQIIEPHSISPGLDYPGVGPEHSFLKDIGRAEYYSVTDQEALNGCTLVGHTMDKHLRIQLGQTFEETTSFHGNDTSFPTCIKIGGYNSSTGDISCIGIFGKALPYSARWNQGGVKLQWSWGQGCSNCHQGSDSMNLFTIFNLQVY